MKKIFVLLIFILGIFLRLWKYPFYPFAGHAEEYLFVWSGLSLIEKGVPISWNDLPVYEKDNIYWEGIAPNPTGGGVGVRLLKPWMDEPPLFSLIVGGIAKIYGLPNFTIISPYVIRIPSLIFSFLTMIFVFLLAKKFFGYWIGLLSLLIYSVTPTVVFGSRLAVPENLITFLMVVCLFLITSYLKSRKKWQVILATVLAGIAGLAKPTGFLLVPFVSFFLFEGKKIRQAIVSLITGSLLFWIPFLVYGNYFGGKLFWKVLFYQASRPAGWSSLAFILTNPGFSVEVFLDGFIILGFLSLIYLVFKKERTKEETIILFSFLYAILGVVISGGKHDQLTWYRYPIYPFMAISLSLMIKEILSNPSFFSLGFFIPLVLGNVDLLENPFWKLNPFIQSKPFRITFFILLLPSILNLFLKNKKLIKTQKIVLCFCFFAGVMINIWVVKSRFNLLCDHEHCPLPQKINLLSPLFPNRKK